MIKIVGLGPGSMEAVTIGTLELLKKSKNVIFRTEIHPNVQQLKNMGVKFDSYDNKYETMESFDKVYQSIADDLINRYKELENIVFAVPGHPLVAEKSVEILLEKCKEQNIPVEIYPSISFIDAMIERLQVDPIKGLKIIDSFGIENQVMDKRVGTIVTQVYDKLIASKVKLALSEYYDDDAIIYFVRAAGIKELESIRQISLYELDRQEDIDYLTSVFVPENTKCKKDFWDLLSIMNKLRSEDGCPWDREQTHASLKRCMIEECYEAVEAIEKDDLDDIVEELGDVLLQVVFHAQIGQEDGFFDINDIVEGICNKLIIRHPHVFGSTSVNDSNEVLINWENIKKRENGFVKNSEELMHVAKNLPALIRADKVQKKAAKVGFDWKDVLPAFDKVIEELDEVKEVYKTQNMDKIQEEIGDLIFSVVNIARFLDIDPENALNYTIDKFIRRFTYIEEAITTNGKKIEEVSLEEMDKLWEEAKVKLNDKI
ncbi:bifunctional methyltransferase/pyrophosphohydrolase YabN [Clostridium sp. DL1XJH146]